METPARRFQYVTHLLLAAAFSLASAASALTPSERVRAIAVEIGAPPPVEALVVAVPSPRTQAVPTPTSGRFSVAPDADLTPGVLCTAQDKDFAEFRYGEKIPYCKRNTSIPDKKKVSDWYGIRWEDHGLYQYDHLLSLCLGGSNDLRNLWPMLWDEARKKARMEADLCLRLKQGVVTQKDAVAEELSWFKENAPDLLPRLLSAQVSKGDKLP